MIQQSDGQQSGIVLLLEPWEAADALRISLSQLEKWTAKDLVPSRKIGKLRRYPVADLEAWIAKGCPLEPQSGDGGGPTSESEI